MLDPLSATVHHLMAVAVAVELDSNLATRTDMAGAVSEFKAEIKAELATLEAWLTRRFPGGVTIIVGLAVALIRLG